VRKTLWLAALAVAGTGAAVVAQPSGIKPIASIRQLHDAMISPSSDALFDVGREAPKDDAGWAAVRNHAVILAESGNLLMLQGRAKDKGNWMKLSTAMAAAAGDALRGAESKNADAILDAGDRIAAICEACHEPYRDGGRKMGPPPK
jgi:cytochrome c553